MFRFFIRLFASLIASLFTRLFTGTASIQSDPKNDVYRVQGLKVGLTPADVIAILKKLLGDVDPTIRSLGLHPVNPNYVALVSFHSVPDKLSSAGGKNEWIFQSPKPIFCNGHWHPFNFKIDNDFLGFTPLGDPYSPSTTEPDVDCIIVSGIGGHPYGSWKARGGNFMWLLDDTNMAPPNVRKLLYGYEAKLAKSKSFQILTDIGTALCQNILSFRPGSITADTNPRPIVFIAHSFGGLVVKQAINEMTRSEKGKANMQCISGFAFFGVPHHGMPVKTWLTIVRDKPNMELIESLKPNSRHLLTLDEDFRRNFKQPGSRAISIFETKESNIVQADFSGNAYHSNETETLVVPTSAVVAFSDSFEVTAIPMNRKHDELSKIHGKYDADYARLVVSLKEIWLAAVPTIKERYGITTRERKQREDRQIAILHRGITNRPGVFESRPPR